MPCSSCLSMPGAKTPKQPDSSDTGNLRPVHWFPGLCFMERVRNSCKNLVCGVCMPKQVMFHRASLSPVGRSGTVVWHRSKSEPCSLGGLTANNELDSLPLSALIQALPSISYLRPEAPGHFTERENHVIRKIFLNKVCTLS